MKKLILLFSGLLILSGCGSSLPQYPNDLKDFLMLEVRTLPMSEEVSAKIVNLNQIPELKVSQEVRCLHFDVVQTNPFQFKFTNEVNITECHELSGFRSDKIIFLFNWIDDVFKWARDRNCYLRNSSSDS